MGKTRGTEDDDKTWIFDSLLDFLCGPLWNIPIITFIEERSVIFDPDATGIDDELHKTHDEYKHVVDTMLGSYIQEMNISPADFHVACQKVSTTNELAAPIKNALYEQIWSAENFDVFVTMMTQRNIDLQLEALELLRKKYGLTMDKADATAPPVEEAGASAAIVIPSEQAVKEAVENKISSETSKDESGEKDLVDNTAAIQRKLISLRPVKAPLHFEGKPPSPTLLPSSQGAEAEAVAEETKEDIERREAYLRSQRDKLIAMKKTAREKQLVKNTGRPKTAQAAKDSMAKTAAPSASSVEAEDALQMRRALAQKLREEIVDRH